MDKNYVDYYIELLASTMQDAIIRNISLQANAKLTDIAIGQLNEKKDLNWGKLLQTLQYSLQYD